MIIVFIAQNACDVILMRSVSLEAAVLTCVLSFHVQVPTIFSSLCLYIIY